MTTTRSQPSPDPDSDRAVRNASPGVNQQETPADRGRARTRGTFGRLTSAPWHPLLFAAVIVLSAWFDAAISPYPLTRPLLVALVGAAVLTGAAALVVRSARIGGFVATAVIWVLWSRNLLDLAETAIHRLGVAGIGFAVAIALVVILVARILRRGFARWTVEGATSFLNRGALLLLLVTMVMGVATGTLAVAPVRTELATRRCLGREVRADAGSRG